MRKYKSNDDDIRVSGGIIAAFILVIALSTGAFVVVHEVQSDPNEVLSLHLQSGR